MIGDMLLTKEKDEIIDEHNCEYKKSKERNLSEKEKCVKMD